MTNRPTKRFLTICKISGFTEQKSEEVWLKIWDKIIQDFLEWLIKKGNLENEQLNTLGKLLNPASLEKNQKNTLDLINPILDEDQKIKANEIFGQLLATNLKGFYNSLRVNMSYEQKQVADSYLKTL